MKSKITKKQVIIGSTAVFFASAFAYSQLSIADRIDGFKNWDRQESIKEDVAEDSRKQKEDFLSKQETNNPAVYCNSLSEDIINNSVICNQKNILNPVNVKTINGDFLTLGENLSFFENFSKLKNVYGVLLLDRYKSNSLPNTLGLNKLYMLSINQGEITTIDQLSKISFANDSELGSSKAKKTTTIPSGVILNETKINQLPEFSNVTSLGGIGIVNNQNIILSGTEFKNLSTVHQNFIFINNDKTVKIPGLNSIKTVGNRTSWVYDGVTIRGNDNLQTISGFQNLKDISGFLNISDNKTLKSITGFNNLEKTVGLIIDNNNNLTDISGLKSLIGSHKLVSVKNNPKLLDISALSEINTVELIINTNIKYSKKMDASKNMCFNIKHGLTSVMSVEDESKILSKDIAYQKLCN